MSERRPLRVEAQILLSGLKGGRFFGQNKRSRWRKSVLGDENKKDVSKKISVENSEAHDYRVIAANGAWGGLTPKGELFFDLTISRSPRPNRSLISVSESVARWILDKVERFRGEVKRTAESSRGGEGLE